MPKCFPKSLCLKSWRVFFEYFRAFAVSWWKKRYNLPRLRWCLHIDHTEVWGPLSRKISVKIPMTAICSLKVNHEYALLVSTHTWILTACKTYRDVSIFLWSLLVDTRKPRSRSHHIDMRCLHPLLRLWVLLRRTRLVKFLLLHMKPQEHRVRPVHNEIIRFEDQRRQRIVNYDGLVLLSIHWFQA